MPEEMKDGSAMYGELLDLTKQFIFLTTIKYLDKPFG